MALKRTRLFRILDVDVQALSRELEQGWNML